MRDVSHCNYRAKLISAQMLLLLRRQDYHIGAWRGLPTATATAATSAATASLSDEGLGLTDGLKNEVDACAEMQFSSELHSA